jgi:hypothetical protein
MCPAVRAIDRTEKLLPSELQSRSDTFMTEPIMNLPCTDTALPHRVYCLTEQVLPTLMKSSILIEDPSLAKFRHEIPDPSCTKSRTDVDSPRRENRLNDTALPMPTKSKTLMLEPNLTVERRDIELPTWK